MNTSKIIHYNSKDIKRLSELSDIIEADRIADPSVYSEYSKILLKFGIDAEKVAKKYLYPSLKDFALKRAQINSASSDTEGDILGDLLGLTYKALIKARRQKKTQLEEQVEKISHDFLSDESIRENIMKDFTTDFLTTPIKIDIFPHSKGYHFSSFYCPRHEKIWFSTSILMYVEALKTLGNFARLAHKNESEK